MARNHSVKDTWTKECGCRKCDTYAEFTEYYCGRIEVDIVNDTEPCDECTDFSGKRRYCDDDSEH